MRKLLACLVLLFCALAQLNGFPEAYFTYNQFGTENRKISARLIELINAERAAMDIAMYTLTEPGISGAILDAIRRGVQVRIMADMGQAIEVEAQTFFLGEMRQQGAQVRLWPRQTGMGRLMHNKFIIFSETTEERVPLVWTGSFNFTKAAIYHQENVVILDDRNVGSAFYRNFDYLFGRSIPIKDVIDFGDEPVAEA